MDPITKPGCALHGLVSAVALGSYQAPHLPSETPKGLLEMLPKRPRGKLAHSSLLKLRYRIQATNRIEPAAVKHTVKFNARQPKGNTAGSSQHKEPISASPERMLGLTPTASSIKHDE